MKKYNITKNLNSNGGRNNYSIPIGTTRNIKGSSNRIYQYCRRYSETPLYCMFQFPPPVPSQGFQCSGLKGGVTYSFEYIGSDPLTKNIILNNIPIKTLPGIFEINPIIQINGNNVFVNILTCLQEQSIYLNDFGITFNQTSITDFYNNYTQNLTLNSSTNCPFSIIGSQFKNLAQPIISNNFIPYFLPGTSLSSCFESCYDFNSNISNWNTSNVVNMSNMFKEAYNFNQPIGSWNTSNVVNMSNMFKEAYSFNQPIGSWNVTNVTNMSNMFENAQEFNEDITSWDVSNVTNMSSMFLNANNFNQPIGSWNVTNVTNMSSMFLNANNFNQNISFWNVSNVTNMSRMFEQAINFNQPIGVWNVSNVTDMSRMFNTSQQFNQDISGWIVSNVTDMSGMFEEANNFNQNIGLWNVSNVINFDGMFRNAFAFNNGGSPDIQNWSINTTDPSGVIMSRMFTNASPFSQPIGSWNVSNVINMHRMFRDANSFNQDISGWNVSNVKDMSGMFEFNNVFNQNIGAWNLSSVEIISGMFNGTSQSSRTPFNNGGSPDIQNWSAPNCDSFSAMFRNCNFNQPLTNLVNTSGLIPPKTCTLDGMFQFAVNFNQNIGSWNVSRVSSMASMFEVASQFRNNVNSSISNWSAPLCNNFSNMFRNCVNFNQPLTNLVDTSGLSGLDPPETCQMVSMFQSASNFNQNIGSWNVSRVRSMASMFEFAGVFNNGGSNSIQNWSAPLCINFSLMFRNCTNFNQPLTNLVNTSGLTPPETCTLESMFLNAVSFNNTVGTWNTSNVRTLFGTFNFCGTFNQNIGSWDVSKVTSMLSTFNNCTNFNNGGSNSIQSWSAPLCTLFANMFRFATNFNQPIPNLVDASCINISNMFENATNFNQNIGNWNVSNVGTTVVMFQNATNFNNGGSNSIKNWTAHNNANFRDMFRGATNFNQPLDNLIDTTNKNFVNMSGMFQNASNFNQDISGWIVSNVSSMASMFNVAQTFNQNIGSWNVGNVTEMVNMFTQAFQFNNGGSDSIQNWSAPKCTTFFNMFTSALNFNQPLNNLVDTSQVAGCQLNQMFFNSPKFNNGEIGTVSIPNITANTSTYNNTTKVLTCPGATFLTDLSAGDVIILQSTILSAPSSSNILSISSDTQLVLDIALAQDFNAGQISSVRKQIPGTSPLNWNTINVTSMASMFDRAYNFNQNITTNGDIWNTNRVTTIASMFLGISANNITLFNNGQIITGTTAPMGWTFNSLPNSTNYRLNSRLTNQNRPASLPS